MMKMKIKMKIMSAPFCAVRSDNELFSCYLALHIDLKTSLDDFSADGEQ